MSSDKSGMIETLESAAVVIEFAARDIRMEWYSSIRKAWASPEDKKRYQVRIALAKNLRKIAAYHKPNPLGGPAKIFDAMADRIRAGEKYDFVLADYGFKVDVKRTTTKEKRK